MTVNNVLFTKLVCFLDHQKQTKPKWIYEDEDDDRSDLAPKPPSCPTCNTGRRGDRQSGNMPRDRSEAFRQRQMQRTRRQNESYINETLNVGDQPGPRMRQNMGQRGDRSYNARPDMSSVISLEPATDLTDDDLQMMNDVFSRGQSQRDNIEITSGQRKEEGPSPRTHHQVRGPTSTVSAAPAMERAFNTGRRSPKNVVREPSPPKREVAMVDLSNTFVPESDSTSVQEFQRSGSNDSSSVGEHFLPVQQEGSKKDEKAVAPVPIALHMASMPQMGMSQDPGGGTTPMDTASAASIKQEAVEQDSNVSFDDNSFYMGMYM